MRPEQANRISPSQVQQIAAHAERQDPSIVDEFCSFYAQHPQVVKAVGGLALNLALQHMLKRRSEDALVIAAFIEAAS